MASYAALERDVTGSMGEFGSRFTFVVLPLFYSPADAVTWPPHRDTVARHTLYLLHPLCIDTSLNMFPNMWHITQAFQWCITVYSPSCSYVFRQKGRCCPLHMSPWCALSIAHSSCGGDKCQRSLHLITVNLFSGISHCLSSPPSFSQSGLGQKLNGTLLPLKVCNNRRNAITVKNELNGALCGKYCCLNKSLIPGLPQYKGIFLSCQEPVNAVKKQVKLHSSTKEMDFYNKD